MPTSCSRGSEASPPRSGGAERYLRRRALLRRSAPGVGQAIPARGGAHRAKNCRTTRVVRLLRSAGPKLSCAEVSLPSALRQRIRSDLDYRAGPFVAHARLVAIPPEPLNIF